MTGRWSRIAMLSLSLICLMGLFSAEIADTDFDEFGEGSEMRSQVRVAKQEGSVKDIRIARWRRQAQHRVRHVLKTLS